jgi:hypothetical protein
MVVRAAKVALVVGTALTLVNQGPELAGGPIGPQLGLRVVFTYSVPFVVSLYSMLGTTEELRPGARSRRGGTYLCRGCTGPVRAVVTVAPGERLPPCPQCGPNARWVPRHE